MEHHQGIRAAALQAAATLVVAGKARGSGDPVENVTALANELVPYIERGTLRSNHKGLVDKTTTT